MTDSQILNFEGEEFIITTLLQFTFQMEIKNCSAELISGYTQHLLYDCPEKGIHPVFFQNI